MEHLEIKRTSGHPVRNTKDKEGRKECPSAGRVARKRNHIKYIQETSKQARKPIYSV
jgi:hypothetical protein